MVFTTDLFTNERCTKILKDMITLQNRKFDSTKITLRRYGMGKPTLRRLVKAGVVSEPIRVGNNTLIEGYSKEN
jgi:hypothetical protein